MQVWLVLQGGGGVPATPAPSIHKAPGRPLKVSRALVKFHLINRGFHSLSLANLKQATSDGNA